MTQPDWTRPDWIRQIEGPLAGSGLFLRGAFHPLPEDRVPALSDGRPAGTVVLIGNAGNELWHAFQASGPDMAARHPLDSWVAGYLRAAADALGAEPVDAMTPPYPPIQQWAVRAGAGHRSPINLVIHPDYGLWHTFRGALLTAEALPLARRAGAGQSVRVVRRQALPDDLPGGSLLAAGGTRVCRLRPAGLRRPCRERCGPRLPDRRLPGAPGLPGRTALGLRARTGGLSHGRGRQDRPALAGEAGRIKRRHFRPLPDISPLRPG